MRRLIIAIAALVASVSASAGELDGKAMICERTERGAAEIHGPYGVSFRDGEATPYYLEQFETTLLPTAGKATYYLAEPTTVKWGKAPNIFTLNRKTLSLSAYNSMYDTVVHWQCEVLASWDAMIQALDVERVEGQKRIDEQMKGNKI